MTTESIDEKPPFQYKSSVDESALQYVKFRFTDADDEQEEFKLPKFTGDGGLEGLLYIEEEFRNVQEEYEWNNDACFKHFKKILGGTALTRWKNVLQGLTVAERRIRLRVDISRRQIKRPRRLFLPTPAHAMHNDFCLATTP